MPVPLKLTLCGLLVALLVMVIAPVRVPASVGVKVTLMLHEPPTPKPAPQLFVEAKSPLAVMLVKLRPALPLFVNVTSCAVLLVPTFYPVKPSDVGLSATSGTPIPMPLRVIVFGLLAASLVITTLPVRMPTAVGEKVTLIVQFAACASVEPQVVVWAKSPFATMPAMLSTAPPGFVKVIGWTALVVPMFWPARDIDVVLSDTAPPCPVPLRPMICGLSNASSVMVTVPVRVPVAVGANVILSVQKPPAPSPEPQLCVTP